MLRAIAEFENAAAVLVGWPLALPPSLLRTLCGAPSPSWLCTGRSGATRAAGEMRTCRQNTLPDPRSNRLLLVHSPRSSKFSAHGRRRGSAAQRGRRTRGRGGWPTAAGRLRWRRTLCTRPTARRASVHRTGHRSGAVCATLGTASSPTRCPIHLARRLHRAYRLVSLVGSGGGFMTDGNGTAAVFTSRLLRGQFGTASASAAARCADGAARAARRAHDALVFDDPTNSSLEHVDLWAKFVGASTVVLVAAAAPRDARAARARRGGRAPRAPRTACSASRVGPGGGRAHSDARRRKPLAPYLNSLLLNERVYVPTLPQATAPGRGRPRSRPTRRRTRRRSAVYASGAAAQGDDRRAVGPALFDSSP